MLRSSRIHSFSSMFANLSMGMLEADIHKRKSSQGFQPLPGRYRGIVHPDDFLDLWDSRDPCVKSSFSIPNETVALRRRRFVYSVMIATWIYNNNNKKRPRPVCGASCSLLFSAQKSFSQTPPTNTLHQRGKEWSHLKALSPLCVLVSRLWMPSVLSVAAALSTKGHRLCGNDRHNSSTVCALARSSPTRN